MPSSSIVAQAPSRDERSNGIQDFQSRLNRGNYDDRRDRRPDHRDSRDGRDGRDGRQNGKSWEAAPTPRTARTDRDLDGGSMRVPNKGWDETPRRGPGGWGKAESSRRWDETPRGRRENDDDTMQMNGKEWEEEQVRLDRDWYLYDDEGAVVSAQSSIEQSRI